MVQTVNLTLGEALNKASLFLKASGFDEHLARTYWMMTFEQTLTDVVLGLNKPVKEEMYKHYMQILEQIVEGKPIQYLLGHAYFMEEKFKVTEHTLIPREDTAGIVALSNNFLENKVDAKVLDIGTGTGILAIMIAKLNTKQHVFASDISPEALKVAKENALNHQVNVEFIESNLFEYIPQQSFDLIVSNPPYISEDELDLMDDSVKKFEPSLALFAEDNGLAIYKQLAKQIQSYVKETSMIILEIGFQQGEAVKTIFSETFPNSTIEIILDLNGKNRYVQIEL
ncbi:peptide chain release factor N(5)-glutamine methyltransferase [Aerococcaceae bacterium INB8]|uniref:Release factor glutamine methyltransferase n=1 Tax=Ruoffia halotolerans TaxID=2748684 RepID=A0A839A777_9LACT|nr:peptide chain release factor N(5)-glutamine methyltransferase [Ruoffia halotolerans]MBA5729415.1 peptide chain release factor N(5)-glutamine methyltransferase [Ruoffia halotolerans]